MFIYISTIVSANVEIRMESLKIIERKGDELLVQLGKCFRMDARVYGANGEDIGKMMRIMGPTSSPYALVKLKKPDYQESEVKVRC